MNRVIEFLKVSLLATWFLISIGLGWEAIRLRPAVESGLRAANGTLREADLTLKNLREASATWKQASEEQSQNTSKAMSNVSVAAERLSTFVSRTDNSVNSVLLPALSTSIEQQNAALLETQKDLQANLSQMAQATAELQKTLVAADAVIADPAIKVSLQNLADASESASDATEHLSGITAAGQRTAEYYEKKLSTPQSFAKTLLQAVLQLGSQARILFSH